LQGCWVVPLNPVEQARRALLPQGEKGWCMWCGGPKKARVPSPALGEGQTQRKLRRGEGGVRLVVVFNVITV
jgi:hypothetical protein